MYTGGSYEAQLIHQLTREVEALKLQVKKLQEEKEELKQEYNNIIWSELDYDDISSTKIRNGISNSMVSVRSST